MHPHIGSYAAMWLAAFAVAFVICRSRAKTYGVEARHVDNIILMLMLVAPFGARFFNRLFYYPTELTVWEALQVWKGGGLVFYGGLLFGVASVIIYCLVRRVAVMRMADLAAPGIAAGLAVGRIGCFLSGCCWGDICVTPSQLAAVQDPVYKWQLQTVPALSQPANPLAVQFPAESKPWAQHVNAGLIEKNSSKSLPVHPTQIYEATLAFLLALYLLRRNISRQGELFWTFGILYGVMRFGIEYLRADSVPAYFGFTISQVISLGIFATCLGFFFWNRASSREGAHPDPSPIPLRVR